MNQFQQEHPGALVDREMKHLLPEDAEVELDYNDDLSVP